MLFWIVTIAIIIGWIILVFAVGEDDAGMGWAAFIIGGLIAWLIWIIVAVLLIASGGNHLVGANRVETTHTDLKALGTGDSVEGRFYLGGGFVDGKRVLSFVRENENGSFSVDQVDGDQAQVFEDDGDRPEMVTHKHVAFHWWLSPSQVVGYSYEFTVPVGSVSDDFSVKP